MKYFKSFSKFGKSSRIVESNENSKEKFEQQLQWWNKTYSAAFKFKNDEAEVPGSFAIEKVPGKGVSYADIAKQGLDKLVELLKEYSGLSVNINAHTSSPAASKKWEGSNEKLSQARAENMKKYLIEKGVNAAQLEAVGKGFTEPLEKEDKDNADAQLKNRRAEVTLKGEIEPSKEEVTKEASTFGELKQISLNIAAPNSTKTVSQVYGVKGDVETSNDKFKEIKDIVVRAIKANKYPSISADISKKKYTIEQLISAIDNGKIKLVAVE
jgi:outer membrane protein OmpA-like peptidoglycan-associated protein